MAKKTKKVIQQEDVPVTEPETVEVEVVDETKVETPEEAEARLLEEERIYEERRVYGGFTKLTVPDINFHNNIQGFQFEKSVCYTDIEPENILIQRVCMIYTGTKVETIVPLG